jgi:hypothetical protein
LNDPRSVALGSRARRWYFRIMHHFGSFPVWRRKGAAVVTASALAACALALPTLAHPSGNAAVLDRLSKGQWEIRMRGGGMATRRTCLGDPRNLIQLRHADLPCNQVTVAQEADEVTVQYTCRGKGYGRTRIRLENDALIQIDSQGIENGLPFAFTAEARRTGACAG